MKSSLFRKETCMPGLCCELNKKISNLDDPQVHQALERELMEIRKQNNETMRAGTLSEMEMRSKVLLLQAKIIDSEVTTAMN